MRDLSGIFFTSAATALAALTLVAAADALARGEDPFRAPGLALVVLGAPVLAASALAAILDRRHAAASATGGAVVVFLLAANAMALHARSGFLSLRRSSLVPAAMITVAAILFFFLLRKAFTRIGSSSGVRTRRAFLTLGIGAAAALLVTGARSPDPSGPLPPEVPGKRPNVLLVTIETLRADHLSTYGYRGHRTPAFDRLGAEGTLYEEAYAPAPWTLPSLAAVMTGYYPSVLGIHRKESGIPRELSTLAERLAHAGYATHAIVTNVYLQRGTYGFERGFRSYDHLWELGAYDDLDRHPLHTFALKIKRRWLGETAERLTDRALAWLRSRAGSAVPFFLWLHYFDPHEPYGGPHVRGDLPCGAKEAPAIGISFRETQLLRGRRTLSPPEKEHLVHLYDADIRYLDRHLGRLIDGLDASGFRDDTLLIVTADHGEELWERGLVGHGNSVYAEVTRVPLMVRWPGVTGPGSRIGSPTSLLAIPPTVLRAAGIQDLPGGQADPLLGPDGPSSPVLSENVYRGDEQKALRNERFTVIFTPVAGAWEAFDRRLDAAERRPLPELSYGPLHASLEEVITRNRTARTELGLGEPERAELSDFQREQLRALGYVD